MNVFCLMDDMKFNYHDNMPPKNSINKITVIGPLSCAESYFDVAELHRRVDRFQTVKFHIFPSHHNMNVLSNIELLSY